MKTRQEWLNYLAHCEDWGHVLVGVAELKALLGANE